MVLNKEQKAYKEIDKFLKERFNANDYILNKDIGSIQHFENSYILESKEIGNIFICFEVNTNKKPYNYCLFTRFVDKNMAKNYKNNYYNIDYSAKRNTHFIKTIEDVKDILLSDYGNLTFDDSQIAKTYTIDEIYKH